MFWPDMLYSTFYLQASNIANISSWLKKKTLDSIAKPIQKSNQVTSQAHPFLNNERYVNLLNYRRLRADWSDANATRLN